MTDVELLTMYVRQNLDIQNIKVLPDEYCYQSLTLAAIDAVFSAQARYPSVQNVVKRYCDKYGLTAFRNPGEGLPLLEVQEKISDLIQKMKQRGVLYFAENVFENESITAGRLKAEILLDLLKTIRSLDIERFQDIQPLITQYDKQQELLSKITEIHGIGEATSRYFLMLSGDDQMVKPDTMILGFIRNAIGRTPNALEAVRLIQAVSSRLLLDYRHMNPRLLDYLIWSWQRDQPNSANLTSSVQVSSKIRKNEKKQNIHIQPSKQKESMTIPQKTQQAMFKRYRPGDLLSSTQIKDDVLADYEIPRNSVMPPDYCCNKWNEDPRSGIYHIFHFEEKNNKYRLLPKQDVTKPRQRGNCPK